MRSFNKICFSKSNVYKWENVWCNKVNQELICLVLNRLENVQLAVKVEGTVRLRGERSIYNYSKGYSKVKRMVQ